MMIDVAKMVATSEALAEIMAMRADSLHNIKQAKSMVAQLELLHSKIESAYIDAAAELFKQERLRDASDM